MFLFRHSASARWARLGLFSLIVIAVLIGLSLASAFAGEWRGRVVEKAGISYIENPAEPMAAALTVTLQESWRLGGDSEDENEFFGVLTRLLVDETGNVYLLDQVLSEVKVFSPDGEFLRSIGREGEGPGEFRNARDMIFLPDGRLGVMQLAPGRMVQLTREGLPAGEHALPVIADAGFIILHSARSTGDQLVLLFGYNGFESGLFRTTRSLVRLGLEGEILTGYTSGERTINFSDGVVSERQWDGFENRWSLGSDGRVYAAETWGEYAVSVWAANGEKERVITRAYAHRKRSNEEIARMNAIYEPFIRSVPNGKPGIEDCDHDIVQVHAREDGRLWILSSRGAFDCPEGSLGRFDVFDDQGRWLREVTLMGQGDPLRDGYFFEGQRLFVLTGLLDAAMSAQGGADEAATDEEAEPMAVICYELGEPLETALASP